MPYPNLHLSILSDGCQLCKLIGLLPTPLPFAAISLPSLLTALPTVLPHALQTCKVPCNLLHQPHTLLLSLIPPSKEDC